jgi:hypothetical protein
MSELAALEKLDIALTRSKNEAVSLGDDLLVYLMSMAILHIRRKSGRLGEGADSEPAGLTLLRFAAPPAYR